MPTIAQSSEVAICNEALAMLGESPILSLENDDTDKAEVMRTVYASVRNAVLEAYPWNFATHRRALAQEAEAPIFGYDASFALPNNPYCLKVRDTNVEGLLYKIEGRSLLADAESISIVYTKRVTDVSQFSSLFRSALSARLAATVCYAVTGSTTLKKAMWDIYQEFLSEAEDSDTQEGTADSLQSDELTDSRL